MGIVPDPHHLSVPPPMLHGRNREPVDTGLAPLHDEEFAHLELIDHLTPLIQALERRIATAAGANPTAALLATIPGIGPYRSLLLAAELLPLTRFPRVEHLASYAGLAR